MRFRIHYTWPDGGEDAIDVRGDTIEEIQSKAQQELAQRGGTDPWSEQLD